MAKTSWSDGDIPDASEMNRIEDQLVIQCTSGTRPTGVEGQHIFETDTNRGYYYDGSGWVRYISPRADVTGVTSASGWSATLDYCRPHGRGLFFRITAERTGGGLSAGDVTNETVCTLTGSGATGNFTFAQPIASAHIGVVASGTYQASTGAVNLAALATAVSTNDDISLGGFVLLSV